MDDMRTCVFVLALLVAGDAVADPTDPPSPPPCPPLADRPVPPISARPAPARQAREARKILDPMRDPDYILFKQADQECALEAGDWRNETALRHIFEALELDPSYVGARIVLIQAINQYLENDNLDDAKRARLRTWLAATLGQLRDGAWTGDEAALDFLAHLKLADALARDAEIGRLMDTLGTGGASKLAQAGYAIVSGIWGEEADWARLLPYVSPTAPITIQGRTYRGPKGLLAWIGTQNAGYPARGMVMGCHGGCCRIPFVDDRPHKLQITRVCFDDKLKLRSVARDLSGM